jgi:hypothetical protein
MAIFLISRPSNEAVLKTVTKNTAANKKKIFAWDGVTNPVIFSTKCACYKFNPLPNVEGRKE